MMRRKVSMSKILSIIKTPAPLTTIIIATIRTLVISKKATSVAREEDIATSTLKEEVSEANSEATGSTEARMSNTSKISIMTSSMTTKIMLSIT